MTPLQTQCGPEGGTGIALLFHDRGTRRGWVVSSTAWPHFTPKKDTVSILQEAGRARGPVWTGGKSRPHWDSIPDRPARSSVAVLTELPGPHRIYPIYTMNFAFCVCYIFRRFRKIAKTDYWLRNVGPSIIPYGKTLLKLGRFSWSLVLEYF